MEELLSVLDTSLGEHKGKTLIFVAEKEARQVYEVCVLLFYRCYVVGILHNNLSNLHVVILLMLYG